MAWGSKLRNTKKSQKYTHVLLFIPVHALITHSHIPICVWSLTRSNGLILGRLEIWTFPCFGSWIMRYTSAWIPQFFAFVGTNHEHSRHCFSICSSWNFQKGFSNYYANFFFFCFFLVGLRYLPHGELIFSSNITSVISLFLSNRLITLEIYTKADK